MPRYEEATRYSNSLGITSLVLGVVSIPFMCMPCVGWVGVFLGCIGLLLGVIGLFQSLGRGGYGIGFSIGGIAASLFSAAIGALLMTLLAGAIALPFGAANKAAEQAGAGVEEKKAPKDPAPIAPPDKGPEAPAPPDHAAEPGPKKESDGRQDIIGNVGVATIDAGLRAPVFVSQITGRKTESKDRCLLVTVLVANLSKSAKVDYRSWGREFALDGERAILTDDLGNRYKRLFSRGAQLLDGHVEAASIYPDKTLTDVLGFEPPVAAAHRLNLELPGANVGVDGTFRLSIRLADGKPVLPESPAAGSGKGLTTKPPAPIGTGAGPEPKKPGPPPDRTPERKAAYVRIQAALADVEAAAVKKFGRKPNDEDNAGVRVPYRAFVDRETEKAMKGLSVKLGLTVADLDGIRAEGDRKKWPKE